MAWWALGAENLAKMVSRVGHTRCGWFGCCGRIKKQILKFGRGFKIWRILNEILKFVFWLRIWSEILMAWRFAWRARGVSCGRFERCGRVSKAGAFGFSALN